MSRIQFHKCNECEHYRPPATGDFGYCTICQHEVWGLSVECNRFDEMIEFF